MFLYVYTMNIFTWPHSLVSWLIISIETRVHKQAQLQCKPGHKYVCIYKSYGIYVSIAVYTTGSMYNNIFIYN